MQPQLLPLNGIHCAEAVLDTASSARPPQNEAEPNEERTMCVFLTESEGECRRTGCGGERGTSSFDRRPNGDGPKRAGFYENSKNGSRSAGAADSLSWCGTPSPSSETFSSASRPHFPAALCSASASSCSTEGWRQKDGDRKIADPIGLQVLGFDPIQLVSVEP